MNPNAVIFQPNQNIQPNQELVNNMINMQNQYIENNQFYDFHAQPHINNINTNIAHNGFIYIKEGEQICIIYNDHFEFVPLINPTNWNNYITTNPNNTSYILINYEYFIKSLILEWSRQMSEIHNHINNNNQNKIDEANYMISHIEDEIIVLSNTMIGINFPNVISV